MRKIELPGTLFDTTSLIMLAGNENSDYFEEMVTVLAEPLIFSEEIIVDFPSFKRNKEKFPALSVLEDQATFVNQSAKDEDSCYENTVEHIVPLINEVEPNFINILRRHIYSFDYLDVGVKEQHLYPSTYWEHLTGRLSDKENLLTKTLEKKLGQNRPFSGAALTAIIRVLYYSVVQQKHQTHLALHWARSELLRSLSADKRSSGTNEQRETTLIRMFDEKSQKHFAELQEKWFGDLGEVYLPTTASLIRKGDKKTSLLEQVMDLRKTQLCVDYRSGVAELFNEINQGNYGQASGILARLDQGLTDIISGSTKDPGKHTVKIGLSVPFIGGLGTELAMKIPKFKKTPEEKIMTFFYRVFGN